MVTRDDFKVIVKGLKAAYPNKWFIDKDAFDLWYAMLKDFSYEELNLAAMAWIQTQAKEPTIADLRSEIAKMRIADMTEAEAWRLIYKAVCDSNYNAKQRFDELPDACKRAVGSPEALKSMAMLDAAGMEVAKSNCMRSYKSAMQQQTYRKTISPDTSRLIDSVIGRLEIEVKT